MGQERREVWAKRVERWSESGLSGAEYAAEIGVKEGTLRHWKWALGRESRDPGWEAEAARRGRRQERAAFVEVLAPTARSASGSTGAGLIEPLELILRDGLRIRVPSHFDAISLRRLLEALRTC